MSLPAARPGPGSLPVVLLVEDHSDTRQMYAEFLGSTFEVLQAADGPEALAVMRTRHPDVLITDLSLPGMDGFELIATIRSEPSISDVAIMSLSGYSGQSIEDRAREVGCDRVLQKPCMPDALGAAAAELLQRRAGRGTSA